MSIISGLIYKQEPNYGENTGDPYCPTCHLNLYEYVGDCRCRRCGTKIDWTEYTKGLLESEKDLVSRIQTQRKENTSDTIYNYIRKLNIDNKNDAIYALEELKSTIQKEIDELKLKCSE